MHSCILHALLHIYVLPKPSMAPSTAVPRAHAKRRDAHRSPRTLSVFLYVGQIRHARAGTTTEWVPNPSAEIPPTRRVVRHTHPYQHQFRCLETVAGPRFDAACPTPTVESHARPHSSSSSPADGSRFLSWLSPSSSGRKVLRCKRPPCLLYTSDAADE